MMGGYIGKGLRVDLGSRRIQEESLPKNVLRQFLGGTGIGVKILYDEVPQSVGPFDPENRLILATGPLTGTPAAGSGTYSVVTKSPLTGLACAAQANGQFGSVLKRSGFDFIIFQGASPKPVYLFIDNGNAELLPADDLMGKDSLETEVLLAQKHKPVDASRISVASIGPSGENLVRYAAIQSDLGHFAATGGNGAVLGSKRVKAVVVRGSGSVPLPAERKEMIHTLAKEWINAYIKSPTGQCYSKYGTAGHFMAPHWNRGGVPVKNLTTNQFPNPQDFDGSNLYEKLIQVKSKKPCHACPCVHNPIIEIKEGPYKGYTAEMPEYEDLAAWGPNVGISDPAQAIILTDLNDRLGMDVKEATFVISLVMECFEEGLISSERLDGLKPHWGNFEAIQELLKKIARKEGVGGVLGGGVLRTAQWIGKDALDRAVYVKKGFAPHVHDNRARWGTLFTQVVSNMGSQEGIDMTQKTDQELGLKPILFAPELIPIAQAKTGHRRQFTDSLVVCSFPSGWEGGLKMSIDFLNAVTGFDLSKEEAMEIGERIVNLLRVFSIRNGLKAEDDSFSTRLGQAPKEGPGEGKTLLPYIENVRQEYYRLMGWDEAGRPLAQTLQRLGLGYAIPDVK
jgi:aldehyde:ferredoxin oxidoreductase